VKKLKEKSNSTKKEVSRSNSRLPGMFEVRDWNDFLSPDSVLAFPGKDSYRERLMHDLLQWAEITETLDMAAFCVSRRMRRETLYDLAEQYPDCKKAFDMAKLILAVRRRDGAEKNKLNKDMVLRSLHIYDPEEHKINMYHKEMKTEEDKRDVTFIVRADRPAIVDKEALKKENEGLE